MSYPAFGTAPIKCSKRKCDWKGYERDMAKTPSKAGGMDATRSTCPKCGCDSYYFMTEREVKAWERATKTIKQGEQANG